MGALAFFPWLELNEDLEVEGYRFVRFDRGTLPGGDDQVATDAVLEPYLEGESLPIRRATLLGPTGRRLVDDLDDDEISDLFDLAQLVALAGLAAREYFLPGGLNYSNRETYALIVQRYTDSAGGVAVRTRRRDGSTQGYISRSQYRIRRPFSQDGVFSPRLDSVFLADLLRARDHPDYPTLAEAAYFFNEANSDSDAVPEQAEVVFMVSAFERLLDCRTGREDDLAERLLAAWQPSECSLPAHCSRIPEAKRGQAIIETWIRDFFQHRGFHAHGRRQARHPAIWSPREHLLLGAYAFPLLVKQWLAERELHAPTEDEQADIDLLEPLACADHFAPQDPGGVPQYPWNSIRAEFKFQRSMRRYWERALAVDSVPESSSEENSEGPPG